MSNSNNNSNSNPFSNIKPTWTNKSFFSQGTYTLRVISMRCFITKMDGTPHDIPSLGLILGSTDKNDRRQVKIGLICPKSAEAQERFLKKIGVVLQALEMGAEDFYLCGDEENPLGIESPVLKDRSNPNCPVGKEITVQIAPSGNPVKDEDGFLMTRKLFAKKHGDRNISQNFFWKMTEVEDGVTVDVLHKRTGYYSLIEVYINE